MEMALRYKWHHHSTQLDPTSSSDPLTWQIVWAFAGLFFIPDYPNRRNPRAWWYNDNDADIALERNVRWGKGPSKPAGWPAFKRVFLSPWIWIFAAMYVSMNMATNGSSYFNLWVKSLGRYSVPEVNACVCPSEAA